MPNVHMKGTKGREDELTINHSDAVEVGNAPVGTTLDTILLSFKLDLTECNGGAMRDTRGGGDKEVKRKEIKTT